MEAIPIRGHHLDAIAVHRQRSRKEIADVLMYRDYVDSRGHPFVAFVFGVMDMFSDVGLRLSPGQKIKIVDGPDVICEQCPKKAKCCAADGPMPVGTAFVTYDITGAGDRKIAKELGLKIGETYTVNQIARRMRL